jgi:hypothetical protein
LTVEREHCDASAASALQGDKSSARTSIKGFILFLQSHRRTILSLIARFPFVNHLHDIAFSSEYASRP